MQGVGHTETQFCSPQDILQLEIETREWSCLRPLSDGVQFLPRVGQAGAFLSGPDDAQTLFVWGGKTQVGADEPTGGDQNPSRAWNQVDSVFRYALVALLGLSAQVGCFYVMDSMYCGVKI